jgi:hypothetical protein
MLFPHEHLLFVFVSSLDILFTLLILWLGGVEVNPIAAAVLAVHGFNGMILFKYTLVVLVVLICEVVGRHRRRTGRGLARIAIVITCVPVFLACAQLAFAMTGS